MPKDLGVIIGWLFPRSINNTKKADPNDLRRLYTKAKSPLSSSSGRSCSINNKSARNVNADADVQFSSKRDLSVRERQDRPCYDDFNFFVMSIREFVCKFQLEAHIQRTYSAHTA
jgi:hypothetical protein